MIWYFQDEILAHQQQYRAVFTSPEKEFWGTCYSSNHWKLWSANLYSKVTPRCRMDAWEASPRSQLYTSDQLHLTYSCTAPISTARLNSGHQRASTAWDGFAHSASLQTRCCFRPDRGTTIIRNRYSHTQDSKHGSTLHCHNLGHYCSCSSECSLLPHHHLNKAGKDELCRDPRKLAKERRLTGSSYILTFSCFPLFYLKPRKSVPIFKYEPLVVFQRYNVNHGTCFLMISYHHKSLIYWKTIRTEVKARTAVLEYWFTEN